MRIHKAQPYAGRIAPTYRGVRISFRNALSAREKMDMDVIARDAGLSEANTIALHDDGNILIMTATSVEEKCDDTYVVRRNARLQTLTMKCLDHHQTEKPIIFGEIRYSLQSVHGYDDWSATMSISDDSSCAIVITGEPPSTIWYVEIIQISAENTIKQNGENT